MSKKAFLKIEAGLNAAIAHARGDHTQVAIRDPKQTISDAYLKFALRMVKQQRTIEQLKRNCGVR